MGDRRGRRPVPHEDILINVEAFRGAIRKGDWKLIKIALLPGKTQLFNLAKDPSETTDVAADNPEIVKDLEARLMAYAREQKPSLWIKAQPAFVGNQGKTVLDPDFDIDDSGLPVREDVAGESRGTRIVDDEGHRSARPGWQPCSCLSPSSPFTSHSRRAGGVTTPPLMKLQKRSISGPASSAAIDCEPMKRPPSRRSSASHRRAIGSFLPFPPVPSASTAGPTLQESNMLRRAEPNHSRPTPPTS